MSVDLYHYEELRTRLKEIIFDQDGAVDVVINALMRAPFIDKNSLAPLAIFFVLGQQSSGKKFITSQIARLLSVNYKVFLMGEYTLEEDADRLCTTSNNDGEIFSYIKQNPSCIIVFD